MIVKEDARFKQGRKFMKEKKYEEAIELFSSLLQSSVEINGPLALESAQAYFDYGNALLTKEEENPSNNLLGNVKDEENDNEGDDDENDQNDKGDDEGKPKSSIEEGEEEEPEGDLQIAWETLDTARAILEKFTTERENKLLLSDVHIRLGDLRRFNSTTEKAIEEYQTALQIRITVCEPHDKLLSDAYFALAVAHVYNSSEKDQEVPVDPIAEKELALKNYTLSRNTLELWLERNKTAPPEELAETKDLVDILKETIEALDQEIRELKKDTSSSSSSSAEVTKIGFGSSTSSNSASESKPAVAVNTIQVKKKKRNIEEANAK